MDVNEMTKYRKSPDDNYSARADVLKCLVDGLKFLKTDADVPAQKLANRILANIIIEHLDISGFTIQRKDLDQERDAAPLVFRSLTVV